MSIQRSETKLREKQQESMFGTARMLNYGNPFLRSPRKTLCRCVSDFVL